MFPSIVLDLFEGQISQIFTYLCAYMPNGTCVEGTQENFPESVFSRIGPGD